ncbi:hypothetical protein [Thalassospira sp. TSL5-1]|uniref:hypothetical protein n=1 Tax=Thalassospira sp. TSL5-1 TaxID=1544451 RepID=UPI00093C1612|nr:hypothetical protein [Thalassospira sp. TSL5-1]OKH89620.1 hypothetical protein LF95_06685 [Thalassospira sp. TSL5-1]
MANDSRATTLPVLSPALGERIRHVVDMFDRKKDAAEVAGVIPEQLNRWCQAKSEPRFIGIARLAKAKAVRLEWIVTGEGPVYIHAGQSLSSPPHPQQDAAENSTYPAHHGPVELTRQHTQDLQVDLAEDHLDTTEVSAQKKRSYQTKKTHNSRVLENSSTEIIFSNYSLLSAIITGFLMAEGVDNAGRITQSILATYRDIIHVLGHEPEQDETGNLIAQIVSAIIRQHAAAPHRDPTET